MPASMCVGVLNDMADTVAGDGDIADWIEREVEQLRQSGQFATPVEFIHSYGLGLPSGTADAIEKAFKELVQQDVVLIVGPAIGDNALIATPLADRFRVPTINWSGAERARSKYMFQLQAGHPADEAKVIASYLAGQGVRSLAVAHDASPAAMRILKHLDDELASLEVAARMREGISPASDDAEAQLAAILATRPDALLHLGQGTSAPGLVAIMARRDWSGLRMMNGAAMRGVERSGSGPGEGWAYVATHSDANPTLEALLQDMQPSASDAAAAARGHDLGRLVANAIARAPMPSREGLRSGLEQVKGLAAAQGAEGTLLGFGGQERAALHGRYLVVRQWRDGASVELARP